MGEGVGEKGEGGRGNGERVCHIANIANIGRLSVRCFIRHIPSINFFNALRKNKLNYTAPKNDKEKERIYHL